MKIETYHKINAPFKRDMEQRTRPLIRGKWVNEEFELLKNVEWVAHEKIDGTNIRIHFDGNDVLIGGRTERANIPPHLLYPVLEKLFTKETLSKQFEDLNNITVTLFGEGYGSKIQKGGGKYFEDGKSVGFILFDVKIGSMYLKRDALEDIASNLNIKLVPEVARGTFDELVKIVANGLKSEFGDFYAEGVVAKPACELFRRNGDRVITKIKHTDFFKGD